MLTDVIQMPMSDQFKMYEKTNFESFDLGRFTPNFSNNFEASSFLNEQFIAYFQTTINDARNYSNKTIIFSTGRFEIPPPGLGSCFGEPPFPLPLTGGDEELYSPASCRTGAFDPPSDVSPGFEKIDGHDMEKTIADSKFIAQHMKNKDSFENVRSNTFQLAPTHYYFFCIAG